MVGPGPRLGHVFVLLQPFCDFSENKTALLVYHHASVISLGAIMLQLIKPVSYKPGDKIEPVWVPRVSHLNLDLDFENDNGPTDGNSSANDSRTNGSSANREDASGDTTLVHESMDETISAAQSPARVQHHLWGVGVDVDGGSVSQERNTVNLKSRQEAASQTVNSTFSCADVSSSDASSEVYVARGGVSWSSGLVTHQVPKRILSRLHHNQTTKQYLLAEKTKRMASVKPARPPRKSPKQQCRNVSRPGGTQPQRSNPVVRVKVVRNKKKPGSTLPDNVTLPTRVVSSEQHIKRRISRRKLTRSTDPPVDESNNYHLPQKTVDGGSSNDAHATRQVQLAPKTPTPGVPVRKHEASMIENHPQKPEVQVGESLPLSTTDMEHPIYHVHHHHHHYITSATSDVPVSVQQSILSKRASVEPTTMPIVPATGKLAATGSAVAPPATKVAKTPQQAPFENTRNQQAIESLKKRIQMYSSTPLSTGAPIDVGDESTMEWVTPPRLSEDEAADLLHRPTVSAIATPTPKAKSTPTQTPTPTLIPVEPTQWMKPIKMRFHSRLRVSNGIDDGQGPTHFDVPVHSEEFQFVEGCARPPRPLRRVLRIDLPPPLNAQPMPSASMQLFFFARQAWQDLQQITEQGFSACASLGTSLLGAGTNPSLAVSATGENVSPVRMIIAGLPASANTVVVQRCNDQGPSRSFIEKRVQELGGLGLAILDENQIPVQYY